MSRDERWTVVLGAAALAAAGILGYALFGTDEREDGGNNGGKRVGSSGEPSMSKKKLVSVWTMLVKAMELHKYQIQQVVNQQKAQFQQRGLELPPEALDQMYKQHFEEVLEALQEQVFMQYELTEDELQGATDFYKEDPEVSGIVAELEALYLGDAESDPTPSVEVSIEKLEEIITTGYLQTWVTAYQEAALEFQATGRMIGEDQESLMAFQSVAVDKANVMLTKLLEQEGLTQNDFQKLVIQHEGDPRIRQALAFSQAKQAEMLQHLGIGV